MRVARAVALAAGQTDIVRVFFESSPEGAAFERRADGASNFEAHFQLLCRLIVSWGMNCIWTLSSAMLVARGLGTLLLTDGDPAVNAALEWLPSPAALLSIAETEKAWDALMCGGEHPALLCALLYARLAQWEVAAEIAEGLTQRLLQPLIRIEAWRLLARARASLTGSSDAHAPLLCAIAEASSAGYVWLELLATRELYTFGGCSRSCVLEVAPLRSMCSLGIGHLHPAVPCLELPPHSTLAHAPGHSCTILPLALGCGSVLL